MVLLSSAQKPLSPDLPDGLGDGGDGVEEVYMPSDCWWSPCAQLVMATVVAGSLLAGGEGLHQLCHGLPRPRAARAPEPRVSEMVQVEAVAPDTAALYWSSA